MTITKNMSPARLKACTNCAGLIAKQQDICKHPILKTIMCKPCYFSYIKVYDLTKYREGTDLDGQENYCRWCLDGGDLILCYDESCRNGFCCACIERNFGEAISESIKSSEDWYCFICDYTQLDKLRSEANECTEIHTGRPFKKQTVINTPPVESSSNVARTNAPSVNEPENMMLLDKDEDEGSVGGDMPMHNLSDSEPEPEPEPEPEAVPEAVPELEPEPEVEPEVAPETVPEADPVAEPEAEPKLGPGPEPLDTLVETQVENSDDIMEVQESEPSVDKTAEGITKSDRTNASDKAIESEPKETTSTERLTKKSPVQKGPEEVKDSRAPNTELPAVRSAEKQSPKPGPQSAHLLKTTAKKRFDFKIFSSTTLLGRPTEIAYNKNPSSAKKDLVAKQTEPSSLSKSDKISKSKASDIPPTKVSELRQAKAPEAANERAIVTSQARSAELSLSQQRKDVTEVPKDVVSEISLEQELYVSDDSSDESAFVDARSQPEESQPLRWVLKDAPVLKKRLQLLIDALGDAYTSFDIKRFEANPNEYLSYIDNLETFLRGASSIANRCQDIHNAATQLGD